MSEARESWLVNREILIDSQALYLSLCYIKPINKYCFLKCWLLLAVYTILRNGTPVP